MINGNMGVNHRMKLPNKKKAEAKKWKRQNKLISILSFHLKLWYQTLNERKITGFVVILDDCVTKAAKNKPTTQAQWLEYQNTNKS